MSSVSERFRFDTIKAVMRWRLADEQWVPNFEDLMDDIRNCMNDAATVQELMQCLRDLDLSDALVAERATLLAQDAQNYVRRQAGRSAIPVDWSEPVSDSNATQTEWPQGTMRGAFRDVLKRLNMRR